MKIAELLRKNNLITKEISIVNYHMNLLNCDVEELKIKIPELRDKSKEEIINYIIDIFDKCDQNSPNYDSDLDTEMTRLGMKTDVFNGGHCKSMWKSDTFADDYYGFGNELTSIYDDYIDSTPNQKRK